MKLLKRPYLLILLIIIAGLALRFKLATGSYNYDIYMYLVNLDIFKAGKNIYLHQVAYNYSPFFYYLLIILDYVNSHLFSVRFEYLLRVFLSFVDLMSLFVLLGIAKHRKLPLTRTAFLYFLNPISIIISGHHGQFDNIAIFFLLLGIYLFEKRESYSRTVRIILTWASLTVGIVAKHTIFFGVFPFWVSGLRSFSRGFSMLILSGLVFLIMFIPFLEAKDQIIQNVFRYSGGQGGYGISYFIQQVCSGCSLGGISYIEIYRHIFLAGFFLFTFFVRQKDIIRSCLLSFLFFMTFTSGMSLAYSVLLVAFGALFPSRWFLVFSFTNLLYSLVDFNEIGILQQFSFISVNIIWVSALLWFISELLVSLKKSFVTRRV